MEFPHRIRRLTWFALFWALLVPFAPFAAPIPTPQAAGEAVDGLRMIIILNQANTTNSKTPSFRVELHNVGANDLVLNLGIMLANGKKQYPTAIALALADARGTSRRLELRGPRYISGRVDPFVVPLPVGAAFSIPVDLDNYWAASSKEFEYKPTPGSYSLEAQFIGKGIGQAETNLDLQGIALMPYWQSTVTSNLLRFEVRTE